MKKMKNLIEKIKYGKIVDNYDLGKYHVAGPIRTNGAIGAKCDLSGLIDPKFIGKDGWISDLDFEKNKDYIEFLRKLGQAYLDGRFDFEDYSIVPINSTYFMLPINSDFLTKLINKINKLEEVSFSGEVKHPIDKATIDDIFFAFTNYAILSRTERQEKAKEKIEEKWSRAKIEQTPLEKAEQYLKDLLFWRLDCYDYSDHVEINVQEREKKDKNGLKTNFIIDRNWSKANKGPLGPPGWRVVGEDEEKIIISGYQKEK